MLFDKNPTLRDLAPFIPPIQEALDKAAEAELAERKKLCNERAAADAMLEKQMPALNKDLSVAQQNYENATAQQRKKAELFIAAKMAVTNATNGHHAKVSRIDKALIETADPRIQEEISYFRDALSMSMEKDVPYVKRSEKDKMLNGFYKKVETNRPAVLKKHQYLRDCISQLEAMKLEPSFDPITVEALKAGIPSVDEFIEVS